MSRAAADPPAHHAVAAPADAPVWRPTAADVAGSRLAAFVGELAARHPELARLDPAADWERLHAWSVAEPAAFWAAVWRHADLVADVRPDGGEPWDAVLVGGDRMAPPDPVRGPTWFPGARLNFAENLLRRRDEAPAIVAWGEAGRTATLTFAELSARVAAAAAALRADGVGVGDRVAAVLPNGPEAIVAMLAAAALGAVWSSCSPDFGVAGIVDRLAQIGSTARVRPSPGARRGASG